MDIIHQHFSNIDATNEDTALAVLAPAFVLIMAVMVAVGLVSAGVLSVWCAAITTFLLIMLAWDYDKMYAKDQNADGSFDLSWDISYYSWLLVLVSMYILETPRYVWRVTVAGAYIIEDKLNPNYPPQPYKISGGSMARAI
jgi:hypothetical protein